MIKVILFLVTLQISSIIANDDLSTEDVITSLQRDGKIALHLSPTMHAYKAICEEDTSFLEEMYPLKEFQTICNVVVSSNICRQVREQQPEDLLKCDSVESTDQFDLWEFLKGCTKGLFNSAKEFLSFIWEILRWVWTNSTSNETREETFNQASEYVNGVKLYLHTEFEKSYAETGPPFRLIKAVQNMSSKISTMIINLFSTMINDSYNKFGCLNFEAKSKILCTFIGGAFIPPAGALGLIKYGPKAALKMFPNIQNAFTTLKKSGRATQATNRVRLLRRVGNRMKIEPINNGRPIMTEARKVIRLDPETPPKGVVENFFLKKYNRSRQALAHHYRLTINNQSHSIKLIIPSMKDGRENHRLLEKMNKALADQPEEILSELDEIFVSPYRSTIDIWPVSRFLAFADDTRVIVTRDKTTGKFVRATGQDPLDKGKRYISFFPSGYNFRFDSGVSGTMSHELGHIVAAKKYGALMRPDQKWLDAVKADGKKVSSYGNTNIEEDFVEAMRVYVQTDGGSKNPRLLRRLANRFKILDEIMKMDVDTRKEILEEFRSKMARHRIYWTTATVGEMSVIRSFTVENDTVVIEE